jgi:SAM-dependent methyltransferase
MSFYTEFAAHYEQIFPFRPTVRDFLVAHLPPRGRILDLGCGPGHYCGALAALDFEMIGLDLDEAMIRAARDRYSRAWFAVCDATEVAVLLDEADGAYCIGNVLPHLAPGDLEAFLHDLAAILPDGAPWLMQTVNYDRLLPLTRPHVFPDLDAGQGLVFRRRYELGRDGCLRFITALVNGAATVFEGEEKLWPLTSSELDAHHRAAGFRLVRQDGGFSGEAYLADASPGMVQVYARS